MIDAPTRRWSVRPLRCWVGVGVFAAHAPGARAVHGGAPRSAAAARRCAARVDCRPHLGRGRAQRASTRRRRCARCSARRPPSDRSRSRGAPSSPSFTVWLSFTISASCFLLLDVYRACRSRRACRALPLLHYAVLLIGFVMALAATAWLTASRSPARSVSASASAQTIVNNFVSGLVLLFERSRSATPSGGHDRRRGAPHRIRRARCGRSRRRVIVPNGDLISARSRTGRSATARGASTFDRRRLGADRSNDRIAARRRGQHHW